MLVRKNDSAIFLPLMSFSFTNFSDFSGVQSEFDRDLIKMRRIFRIPLSCGKMGKWEKQACSEKLAVLILKDSKNI